MLMIKAADVQLHYMFRESRYIVLDSYGAASDLFEESKKWANMIPSIHVTCRGIQYCFYGVSVYPNKQEEDGHWSLYIPKNHIPVTIRYKSLEALRPELAMWPV